MQYNHNDLDVARELGGIRQEIKSLKELFTNQEERVTNLEGKVNNMLNAWGKMGLVLAIIGGGIAVAWNIVFEFIKDGIRRMN